MMGLDKHLEQLLQRALTPPGEAAARSSRLVDDAQRLCRRIRRFLALGLTPKALDLDALDLACYAIQLPLRQPKAASARIGQFPLRERCEQAIELLVALLASHGDGALLENAAHILRELPRKAPAVEEARVLADALNLDDFGMTGLLLQAMHVFKTEGTVGQVADGFEKRELYGYWDARLKDGFHFDPVREMARQRIERARQAAMLLKAELAEDQLS